MSTIIAAVKKLGKQAILAILTLCAAALPAAAAESAHGADSRFAFLDRYCSDCHNDIEFKGKVAFDSMTPEGIPAEAKVWEAAVRKLRGRLMPPPGKPQPGQAEINSFVSWMEGRLDDAARDRPNPGRVALHRLNRKEYGNAVRDLLGTHVDVSALLPQDDASDAGTAHSAATGVGAQAASSEPLRRHLACSPSAPQPRRPARCVVRRSGAVLGRPSGGCCPCRHAGPGLVGPWPIGGDSRGACSGVGRRGWVGLTDEEIQTEWVLTPQNDKAEGIWFGRRIEAKLRSKNHD